MDHFYFNTKAHFCILKFHKNTKTTEPTTHFTNTKPFKIRCLLVATFIPSVNICKQFRPDLVTFSYSDDIPEKMLKGNLKNEKKSEDKKRMQNYPACKASTLSSMCGVNWHAVDLWRIQRGFRGFAKTPLPAPCF